MYEVCLLDCIPLEFFSRGGIFVFVSHGIQNHCRVPYTLQSETDSIQG